MIYMTYFPSITMMKLSDSLFLSWHSIKHIKDKHQYHNNKHRKVTLGVENPFGSTQKPHIPQTLVM